MYEISSVNDRREYCCNEFNTIYPEIKRLNNPHEYYVDLSQKLYDLKNKMINDIKIKRLVR